MRKGVDHPDTLKATLALVELLEGHDWEALKPIYSRALEAREKLFGHGSENVGYCGELGVHESRGG